MTDHYPQQVLTADLRRYTQVVTRPESDWLFQELEFFDFIQWSDTARIVEMSFEFGIVEENQEDPTIIHQFGRVGDFLVLEDNGDLGILSKELYNKLT